MLLFNFNPLTKSSHIYLNILDPKYIHNYQNKKEDKKRVFIIKDETNRKTGIILLSIGLIFGVGFEFLPFTYKSSFMTVFRIISLFCLFIGLSYNMRGFLLKIRELC